MEYLHESNTLRVESADSGVSRGVLLIDDGVIAENSKTGITVIGVVNS